MQSVQKTVFHCQICKSVGFLLLSSSGLLKLPNREFKIYDATVAKTSLKNCKFKFVNLFRRCPSLCNFLKASRTRNLEVQCQD